ncbi:MAG: signal peptidase I [Ruminococcus sp.]|nr:signal peptidase I [Ruminococcus sp.]
MSDLNNIELSSDMIEAEIKRIKRKKNGRKIFRETIFTLIVVAAIAVLAAMLFFPIFRVTGSSMEPSLKSDEIIICLKTSKFETGDIVAFYYNNKILLKRVIGSSGDTIDIDDDGNVFVNGCEIYEPYISKKSKGKCDIEFPYQVPDNRIFVMGDNRETSVDSRSTTVGCIADEYILGKVFFRIWPLNKIDALN